MPEFMAGSRSGAISCAAIFLAVLCEVFCAKQAESRLEIWRMAMLCWWDTVVVNVNIKKKETQVHLFPSLQFPYPE